MNQWHFSSRSDGCDQVGAIFGQLRTTIYENSSEKTKMSTIKTTAIIAIIWLLL